jgi:hypothetical protein
LYFNTSSSSMKVWNGSAWLDAYASLSGALIATNNLSDLNNTATARANLGVAIGTNVQAYDADLSAIAALAPTADNFIVGNGTTWTLETPAQSRTSLGLGTAATTASTDYATAAQGTLAGTALQPAAIGSTVQGYDADLQAIGDIAGTSGLLKKTAANTWSLDTSTYLTSAVTSVTGTAPVVSSGGATPAISMAAATSTVNGYMTSTYAAKLDGIAAGATANTGTVTSVGGTGTVSGLSLSGTVTTTGNLTLGGTLAVTPSNFASQTANTVLAAPTGVAGVPTFRAIVAADIPTLNQNTTGTASNVTGTVAVANGGTGSTTSAGALTNLGAYAASNPNSYTSNTLTAGTGISVSASTGASTITNTGVTSIVAGTGISISGAAGAVTVTNSATSAYVGNRGQAFTANGTFTIPTGVTALKITVVGGGGGGGSSYGQASGNGTAHGGGGGGAAISYLTSLTAGNTLAVTVGGGGAAGGTGTGGTGGTSSVASGTQTITTISATGGVGSVNSFAAPTNQNASGGVGSAGTINLYGNPGGLAVADSLANYYSGAGGASLLSPQSQSALANTRNAIAGQSYGGGGGGASGTSTGQWSAAAGAAGIVIFEW